MVRFVHFIVDIIAFSGVRDIGTLFQLYFQLKGMNIYCFWFFGGVHLYCIFSYGI
jgi:hypothetical protein